MDRTDELLGKVEEKVRCLERLFQATDLAMVVTDLENMILYINKNFSSILRIPDDQLIGENLFKFLEIINIDDEAFWKGLLSKIHRKEPLEGVKYKVKERIFQIDGSIVECEEDKEAIF
ncbi:MAG TPA: PAS domain-containing protein, partial [Deltaproteobacteria bacterium]|nr:PAS domain-containing protein [Deltaproteobacteria bacterium]